jgi:hypothetical protein
MYTCSGQKHIFVNAGHLVWAALNCSFASFSRTVWSVCVCTCIYEYLCILICTCMCVCIYIYIYTHTPYIHTCIHTNVHANYSTSYIGTRVYMHLCTHICKCPLEVLMCLLVYIVLCTKFIYTLTFCAHNPSINSSVCESSWCTLHTYLHTMCIISMYAWYHMQEITGARAL